MIISSIREMLNDFFNQQSVRPSIDINLTKYEASQPASQLINWLTPVLCSGL